jgi:hypothetical protein
MAAEAAPIVEALVVPESDEGLNDPELFHLVHTDCQPEGPFVIAMCGYLLDREAEYNPDSPLPRCEPCHRPGFWACPVCGLSGVRLP